MDAITCPTIISSQGKAKTRKISTNLKLRKRYQQKLKRYQQKHPPKTPTCQHKSVNSVYKCDKIRAADAQKFAKNFYMIPSKISQDSFLLSYCPAAPSKRRRTTTERKNVTIQYHIRKVSGIYVRVCQKAFSGILGIKVSRILGVIKRHLNTGTAPTENRGGDRHTQRNTNKKKSVIEFIQRFKVIELHYCRSKITQRQYLPSELNINKMYRMYKNENQPETELYVKNSFFRNTFNQNFNIGFKTPSSDLCSTCIQLAERLKHEINDKKKQDLMAEKVIHKRRAKAFYELLKEEKEELITISFDCQKNMTLPKVADQSAYYSRQLYIYNLGVVIGSSKTSLTKDNVMFYTWTENEFLKGSNQVASAIYHCLCDVKKDNKTSIRLVADGCGGQNKNTTLVGMCFFWLLTKAPPNITSVEIIFPIPGHSFMPPDRTFALIEKEVKNKQEIIKPEEYYMVYENHGTVIRLGSNSCSVFDWKTAIADVCRPPGTWHFKFNQTKRFVITRNNQQRNIKICGETTYRSNLGVGKSVLRKGKKLSKLQPELIQKGVKIKDAKLKDVSNLLIKHFGENWKELEILKFYDDIIHHNESEIINEFLDPICEPILEEDVNIRI